MSRARTRTLGAVLVLVALMACRAEPPAEPSSDAITPATQQKAAEALPAPDAQVPAPSQEEADRERVLGMLVANMLQTQHVRRKNIDDATSKAAFEEYLKRLDPTKMFLLASDVEKLKRHEQLIDDELKAGRLDLAREGAALVLERQKFVHGMIRKILARPLDLGSDGIFETDPEKRQWAADNEELKKRWQQSLKLGVMQRMERIKDSDKARAKAKAAQQGDKEAPEAADKAPEATDKAPEAEDKVPAKEAVAEEAVPGYEEKTDEVLEAEARKKLLDTYDARFKRLAQQDHVESLELFFNAVAGVFDPYTVFMPPVRKENFDIGMSGSLEGIGAVLSEDEHFVQIVRIVPGSASWRQGQLEAGDRILAVAQGDEEAVDVLDMRLNDVVQLIRGPKGTVVTLTVQKADERVLIVPITRDVVQIEESYAKGAVIEREAPGQKYGYIDLPSFYGNTRGDAGSTPQRRSSEDVRKLLAQFEAMGVKKVILDLRGNGGGLLEDARIMSGLFIPDGPIVQTREMDAEPVVLRDFDKSVVFTGDVVVMIDRFSASASEIVAAALQDYGRAVVVGTSQTHGKGTVQMLMSLDRAADPDTTPESILPLGVFKLTRQQFYRITGGSTQHKGVMPDVTLPDPFAHIESGERYMDYSIPWSQVDALEFEPWAGKDWNVGALAATSQERQNKDAEFARVLKRSELLKARIDDTTEPLGLTAWRNKRDREEAEIKALDPPEEAPARFKVTPVDYDGQAKAPTPAPKVANPGRKLDLEEEAGEGNWPRNLARDPWVDEALRILGDM